MTKSQAELRAVYELQLEADDRKFGAMMEAIRLLKTGTPTVDDLVAGMVTAGYSNAESRTAFNAILERSAANKGTHT